MKQHETRNGHRRFRRYQEDGFSGAKNQNGVLRIEFADGSAVDYLDVGYSSYRKFVLSRSIGKFYNDHIRGKFKPK